MEVEFKLDAFQGPLDLLLHLILKHKLNICDIEISLLLEQYLEYMNQLDEQDYESAGEFLEMAARLIYIKTVSLLPQPEEAEELKKDLEGQIIEYSICKLAAQKLKEMYAGNDIFVREPVGVIVDKTYTRVHEPQVIYDAFMGISAKSRNSKPLRADMFSPIVSHKIVSVTSKIIFVLKRLYKTGVYEMSELYDGVTDKSERVATFLAVLELTKSGRIYINNDNTEIRFIKKDKSKVHKNSNDNLNANEVNVDEPTDNTEKENAFPEENSVAQICDIEVKTEYDAGSEIKPEVKILTERVYIPQIVASDTEIAVTSSEPVYKLVENQNNNTLEQANIELDYESQSIIETFEDSSDESCEELLGLIHLAEFNEPPINIFKPNYWNKRKYYWGKSPVGQNGRNNYWFYG